MTETFDASGSTVQAYEGDSIAYRFDLGNGTSANIVLLIRSAKGKRVVLEQSEAYIERTQMTTHRVDLVPA